MQNTIKSKSGRVFLLPTEEEEAAINAGIAADPDTYEPTDEEFTRFKPVKPGRPFAEQTKERITIRLSPDVLEKFRSTGTGWQTRIDAALKDWINSHPELS